MARKNTIRLLLINASDNDTELMVSLFRSAGRVARAQRAGSADELAALLAQDWDLLIADDHHPELKVEDCLAQLRRLQSEIPALVQRDGGDIAALFAAGAADVIAPADDQRLIGAALREVENLDLRRGAARLRRQLQEAEQRNALLLGEADQAIAYVADGMVIGANALFAERFGYADAAELDCVPIVDLVSCDDQDGFKSALKNALETDFRCTGQRADGAEFDCRVRLRNATYDDDPCTQLIVEAAAPATAEAGGDNDADTGLFNRGYLMRQLEQRGGGWLALLRIERFGELRRETGFGRSVELAREVAGFIAAQMPRTRCAARVADDTFALLLDDGSAESLTQQLDELCAAAAKQQFTTAAELRAGVAAISGAPPELLDDTFAAIDKTDAKNPVQLHRVSAVARKGAADSSAVLEDALHDERFALLYQPVISLRGAGGEHYEALLRLRGSGDVLELADNFVEALGVGADNAKLDRWILLEATKQLAANRDRGNDTRLLINLTANALQDDGLPSWLGVAIKAAGLPGAAVILQLRETDVLNDQKAAKKFADAVHQIGCRMAICGFGRLQEPDRTLRSIGADIVQLDGSFTRGLMTGGDVQAIKELVTAASDCDVKTIVPFVENASVLATLWQVGADFIQGHYLQAPGREMNYEFTDIA